MGKISGRKAVGQNLIPNDILKEYKGTLKVPLTIIINISFITGGFQKQCKTAHIAPGCKTGDKLDNTNYRPIWLLSNISKITEKTIHSRLHQFLNNFNCVYKNQFDFQNSHSINHALASITEEIRKALDNEGCACGVFLDFKKAF